MIFNFLQHDQNKISFELGNGNSITYGEFKKRLQAYVGYLQQQHIQQGARVILWLPNDLSLILGYYACLYLGAISVPAFAENTAEEINTIQQVTSAKYVLTTPNTKKKLTDDLQILDITHISNNKFTVSLLNPQWPENTDAILFMTSGSTGKSKAVTYTHKTLNWANKIYQQALQITADDRLLTTLDLYGNAGFTFQILPLLNAGATIQLLPEQTGKAVYQAIEQGTTIMCMIPYLGMKLLDYAADKPLLKNKLKTIVVGGDRIPDRIFADFPQYFNAYPNQGIGMSETNIYAINLHHPKDKPGSAGTIMPYTKVKIVSSDGTTQAANDMGEIWVNTPMRFDRYWNAPGITQQTITDDWVRTGDLGYFDEDGYLYFADRIKQIIINCGENIYPQEVEAACMQHPNIKSAIAVGIAEETVGEEIGIGVTLHNSEELLSLEQLQKFLQPKLADFKIPTKLCVLDKLPENKVGKIDRQKLKSILNRYISL